MLPPLVVMKTTLSPPLMHAGVAAASNLSLSLLSTPVLGMHATIQDLGTGAYLLNVNAARAGTYRLNLTTGTLGHVHLAELHAVVLPGLTYGPSSRVLTYDGTELPGSLTTVAGAEVVTFVQQRDRMGNPTNTNASKKLMAEARSKAGTLAMIVVPVNASAATHRHAQPCLFGS